ncbi:beta-ketoacyl-[acyl-carrier-protein] synthase family protein [Oryzobacter telluris]|uniref:beta-ketoacyl-[acyl-carrier-protein] synthase family protein n=1 Tax=Oryzobacter telluris TaxID=3149179 RepID=UPI00370D2376
MSTSSPARADVVVTGIGAVSALGGDAATTWRHVLDGRSALRPWDDLAAEGHAVSVACRVGRDVIGPEVAASHRGRALGLRAATESLADAELIGVGGRLVDGLDPSRVGVFIGTTMGESGVYEEAEESGHFDLAQGGSQVLAQAIAHAHGITGPVRTLGTACAAGNYAIGAAARAVASGRLDVAVAGGVEPFSRIAMVGFTRMRAMAPEGCAPFGTGRRGMTLGEGAGILVLRRAADVDHARAVVRGLGLSADAHHPTAPREDGSGMAAAMRAALRLSDLTPEDIGWVSAHGTGTPRSDAAEALALRAVFGDRPPPVSSIKGALGHALGAATALEAVVSVRALEKGILPPNAGVVQVDPALEVDVVLDARPAPGLQHVLSCGYAFGGLNSALVLGRAA